MTSPAKTLIVIVSYNAKRYMQECIKSIRNTCVSGTYKTVVVDNASTDGIAVWLSEQSDILFIPNSVNVGFGPACNQAVAATKGTEYEDYDVFLLNNDTVLCNGSMDKLKRALYSSDDIGATGAMSNYAGNRQQLDLNFGSTDEYVGFGNTLSVPDSDRYLEKVRLNGFAMLIKRHIWDSIGGFDEDFAPGYYEDDAISMEILKKGYRLLLVRDSFIYHVGSASFVKTGTNTLSIDHHRLFIQKYGFDILDYVYPCGAVMSQIPFARTDSFRVLHLGCGLGAELKAIKSLFPKAEAYGVEPHDGIRAIASGTENIYPDVTSASASIPSSSINLLIVDSNYLPRLTDSDKTAIVALCSEGAIELNRLHAYDNYPFDDVKLVVLPKALRSPILEQLLSSHGIMNIESPKDGLSDLLKATGISSQHILTIDEDSTAIIPYLMAHFGRLSPTDKDCHHAKMMSAFLERYEASKSSPSRDIFLQQSDLELAIEKDCLKHTDHIKELLDESHTTNDIQPPLDNNRLERLFTNDWNDCGYITAKDKYGDLGIVGFFCYDHRQKKMLYYAKSWLAKDFAIEEFVDTYLASSGPSDGTKYTRKIRILFHGDKSLSPIEDYLIGGYITSEHTDHIPGALFGAKNSLPTLMYSNRYHIIIYSLLQYDYDSWEKNGDKCLSDVFGELDKIYEEAAGNPTIILLLGIEIWQNANDTDSCKLAELYSEINPVFQDYANDHERIRLINATEFIQSPGDFSGNINHFGVRVLSDIAERICIYINEKVDEILTRST